MLWKCGTTALNDTAVGPNWHETKVLTAAQHLCWLMFWFLDLTCSTIGIIFLFESNDRVRTHIRYRNFGLYRNNCHLSRMTITGLKFLPTTICAVANTLRLNQSIHSVLRSTSPVRCLESQCRHIRAPCQCR